MRLYKVNYIGNNSGPVGLELMDDDDAPTPEFILADSFEAAYNKAKEFQKEHLEVAKLELAIPGESIVSAN